MLRRRLLATGVASLAAPAIVRAQTRPIPHRYPDLWADGRVPLGRVSVNWTHPLTRNLLCCYLPGNPHSGLADLCGVGPILVPNSAAIVTPSPTGPGLLSNGTYAQSGAISATQPVELTNRLNSSTGCSLGWCGAPQWNTSAGPAPMWGITVSGTRKCCLLVGAGTTPPAEWNYFNGGVSVGLNTGVDVAVTTANTPPPPIVAWAVSFSPSGQTLNWVVNSFGVLHTGTATSSFNPTWAAGDRLAIGYGLSDANAFTGVSCLGVLWGGGMSMDALEQWVTAPFSIFQPAPMAARPGNVTFGRPIVVGD